MAKILAKDSRVNINDQSGKALMKAAQSNQNSPAVCLTISQNASYSYPLTKGRRQVRDSHQRPILLMVRRDSLQLPGKMMATVLVEQIQICYMLTYSMKLSLSLCRLENPMASRIQISHLNRMPRPLLRTVCRSDHRISTIWTMNIW